MALCWPVHELQFKSVLRVSVRPDIYCLCMQNLKIKQETTRSEHETNSTRFIVSSRAIFVPYCSLVTSEWTDNMCPFFFPSNILWSEEYIKQRRAEMERFKRMKMVSTPVG